MNFQEKIYTYPLPTRYVLSRSTAERLVIVLHGYQDNAPSVLKRLGWGELDALPFQVLAPNAPFPVPVWHKDGFKEAYSWYFRDTDRKLVYVRPSTTAERMAQFLGDLSLLGKPTVLFGFSQGGYLAPFLGKFLPNLRGIVGLGCGYTEEGFADLPPTRVWGLHGTLDERIPLEKARAEHADVLTRGHRGGFIEIPKLTHKVDAASEPMIRELIDRCFKEN